MTLMGDGCYKGWLYVFVFEDHGTLYVVPRCIKCGRFIKAGKALVNYGGDSTRFEGFQCKHCGEVQPESYWW